MNSKTSKLCRKFARHAKQSYKKVKRLWKRTPKRYRNELRRAMKADAS